MHTKRKAGRECYNSEEVECVEIEEKKQQQSASGTSRSRRKRKSAAKEEELNRMELM